MSLLTIIILMAILYLVPELLRKRKKVKYEYPTVPPKEAPQKPHTAAVYQPDIMIEKPTATAASVAEAAPVKSAYFPVDTIKPQQSGWQNLDQAAVLNGLIFSQVLEPPRAYRPLYYKKKS